MSYGALGPLARQQLYTTLGSYWHLMAGSFAQAPGSRNTISALEAALSRYTDVPNITTVPRARTGIYLALKSLIQPGDRVLLSPYTIAEVVNMVLCAGGIPVFCDIERETCNINLAELEWQIDDDISCVLATHFYGLACDIGEIAALCEARRIPLIEDCAQAIGTRVNGRMVGGFGKAGVFSFGLHKSVTGFLGGAVISHDSALVDEIAAGLATWPWESSAQLYGHVANAAVMDIATFPPLFQAFVFRLFRYGYLRRAGWAAGRFDFDANAERYSEIPERYCRRMSPGQAKVALAMLKQADQHIVGRIQAAKRYHAGLSDLPELTLPPMRDDGSHTYQYFAIQFSDREALVDDVMRHGRDLALSHHRNCADLPCFSTWFRDCPNARRTAQELIYLPTYPGYDDGEIDRMIAAIRRFFGR